jgi:tetratricopeptide (TPR) repeat protein
LATIFSQQQIEFAYNDVVNLSFTPKLKGTLQPQMKATARKYGLIPYEIKKNLKSVLSEISNDTPVLVLFNIGLNIYPMWHYSVAIGFDKAKQKIFLSAPKGDETWMTFDEFDTFFERGGSWAVVMLKPPTLPSSADETEVIKAILDMYDIGAKALAKQAAISYVVQNPLSYLGALTLANIYFFEGEFEKASELYEKALNIVPNDPALLNNLAGSLLRQNKLEKAREYAIRAVNIGGLFSPWYKNTLEEINTKLQK